MNTGMKGVAGLSSSVGPDSMTRHGRVLVMPHMGGAFQNSQLSSPPLNPHLTSSLGAAQGRGRYSAVRHDKAVALEREVTRMKLHVWRWDTDEALAPKG